MENYIAQATFLVVGIGAVIASRHIKNPVTAKASRYTGWTALALLVIGSVAEVAIPAMAS